MLRVAVNPALLEWACDRSGVPRSRLETRFPRMANWFRGTSRPTLKQLEAFAKATHAPLGCFFLPQPPRDILPIPDFRTMAGARRSRPSADLLDTIYLCQQRQEWYRDFARATGEAAAPFVGSVRIGEDVTAVAERMRTALGFDLSEREQSPTWTESLRRFIDQTDSLGVLVMVNGVVGSNTHRRLNPEEFRGFALADPWAPLVFINGSDTKAAQMFTLAHELAHLWLGESALSDTSPAMASANVVETWCNQVAAELLVPLASLRREWRGAADSREVARLARNFKVSTLVILRRIHDAGGLNRSQFRTRYAQEVERLCAVLTAGGGDFYRTTASRVGKRFARAVVSAAAEGQVSFTEAFRLLGFKSTSALRELGLNVGIAI